MAAEIRLVAAETDGRISLLMQFAGRNEDIEDPWYSGNFGKVYAQIEEGCRAMLERLR